MSKEDTPMESDRLRTNTKLISSLAEPVYTFSTSINNPNKPLVTTSLGTAYAQIGQYFTISTGAQLSGATDYLYLQLALPPHWTKEMHIDRLRAGSASTSVPATVEIHNQGATPLGLTFTSITPINTNFLSTNTTLVTAGYAVSSTNITTGNLIFSYIQDSGTANLEFDGRIIISNPTAVTLYFYMKLIDNSNSNCLLGVSWWESSV